MPSKSARPSRLASLALCAAFAPSFAMAIDPASLRVSTASPDIRLSWTDSTPGIYCVSDAAIGPPLTGPPALGLVQQVDGSAAPGPPYSFSITRPRTPDSLVFYDVADSVGGNCAPCQVAGSLACGVPLSSSTTAAGSSQVVSSYPGCGVTLATGSEIAFAFTATASGATTAQLTGFTASLVLVVLEDATGCDPAAPCVASGPTASWSATAGTRYVVVVDGLLGDSGAFTLEVTCPSGIPTCASSGTLACGGAVSARNDAATDAVDAYVGCAGFDATGPEIAYRFDAVTSESVTATLAGLASDLDVYVLRDAGAGCDPAQCEIAGDVQATFAAVAGATYYVVVEGRAGAVGPFDLALSCGSTTPTCAPNDRAFCSRAITWSTTLPVVTDVNDAYPCHPGDYGGEEQTYVFTAARDGMGTLSLSMMTGDLDVFVVDSTGSGCDPDGCIAWGDVTTTFPFVAGRTYYVVIDGVAGATSDFRLDYACALPPSACEPIDVISCDEILGNDTAASQATDRCDAYPACGLSDLTGPEMAYQFTVDSPTDIVAEIAFLTADLDVLVLEEHGGGCDPATCIAAGDSMASFQALPGHTYYLVVDGRAGATSDFVLVPHCSPVPGACSPVGVVTCGATVSGDTLGAGATDVIDVYPDCPICAACPEDGPEMTYAFTATTTGQVTVTLSNMAANLDVVVLEDTGSGCRRADCAAVGGVSATFTASAGTQYYFVVDGFAGAGGSFDLTVSCL